MSGFLEETRQAEAGICTWQTPIRQRFWGLGGCAVAGLIMSHALSVAGLRFDRLNSIEFWVGAVAMVIAILATTYTTRFTLNFRSRTYAFTRGFLPILLGEKGVTANAVQAIALRRETSMDAGKHDGETNLQCFEQFRIILVWKTVSREAMLLDTFPSSYEDSKRNVDFHALAMERAHELSEGTGVQLLDQTLSFSLAAVTDEVSAPDVSIR